MEELCKTNAVINAIADTGFHSAFTIDVVDGGKITTVTCRLGFHALKHGATTVVNGKTLIHIYDVVRQEYRSFDTQLIRKVRARLKEWTFAD